MSKSNSAEVISLLYVIVATQTHGLIQYVAVALAVENVLESVLFAFQDARSKR